MFLVLFTAILSFGIIGSNVEIVDATKSIRSEYKPELNVKLTEFETSKWNNGVIGRHQMVSFDGVEYLGPMSIKKLSNSYNGAVLQNFHFEEKVKTVLENSVSLSIEESSKFTSTLGVKAGLDNIEVNDSYTIEQYFKINNTVTYTVSKEIEYSISYDVIPEMVCNKKFYLAQAAYVYKIECQKWQYDNYWWGNYEVSNSRVKFDTYIALEPYITVCLEDGTLL